jgi:hypothetical protein
LPECPPFWERDDESAVTTHAIADDGNARVPWLRLQIDAKADAPTIEPLCIAVAEYSQVVSWFHDSGGSVGKVMRDEQE